MMRLWPVRIFALFVLMLVLLSAVTGSSDDTSQMCYILVGGVAAMLALFLPNRIRLSNK